VRQEGAYKGEIEVVRGQMESKVSRLEETIKRQEELIESLRECERMWMEQASRSQSESKDLGEQLSKTREDYLECLQKMEKYHRESTQLRGMFEVRNTQLK
jgi:chromosome segregation ATPase